MHDDGAAEGPRWASSTGRELRIPGGAHRAPSSLDELREAIAGASKVRALGSRHSFNALADSVRAARQHGGVSPRSSASTRTARTVTVGGGMRYGDVARRLQDAGWALHNLASLPHISIAGAVATATHGSGDRNGNLATAVERAAHPQGRRRTGRAAARGTRLRRRRRLARRARSRRRGDARHRTQLRRIPAAVRGPPVGGGRIAVRRDHLERLLASACSRRGTSPLSRSPGSRSGRMLRAASRTTSSARPRSPHRAT